MLIRRKRRRWCILFSPAHLARAMQLLGDLVADSQFPERELCKEREVVVDEINSYRDTPSELIYDEFESSLFEGCSLGRNILGDVDSLTRITSDIARRFLTDYYTPENMVFFFMGSTSFNRVRGWRSAISVIYAVLRKSCLVS